jgi:two-component system, OmpR family, sensor histidine kinase KdpD
MSDERPDPARSRPQRQLDWKGFRAAMLTTLAATAAGWPLYHGLRVPNEPHAPAVENTNVLMLYLLGVLWVATRHSRGAAILASLLGVAAFDLCFVPPYLRFVVHDPQYIVTFAVMLLTALTISTLTHRVREQADAARRAWERLEAERLRNTLLSAVSHDLRTPLSAITGSVSSLTETGDRLAPEARTEMLQTIAAEAERMERLINNLLDMTRLESGGLVLKKEWQPLQEVVGSALHHLDRQLRGREIKLSVPADMPLVLIDAVAIEQVLVNLLHNALEYTPASAPIEITATAATDEVTLAVADQGPGLPPGTEQRLFEKFYRAPVSVGQTRVGVGLGLAICKGIIEAHGGRIIAGNRPGGGGAIFSFALPRVGAAPLLKNEE